MLKIRIISFLSLIFLTASLHSQETIVINNESYYIYPHAKENYPSWNFTKAVNIKEKNNKVLLFKKMMPEMAIDETYFEQNFEYFQQEYLLYSNPKISSKILNHIRQNSFDFYTTTFNLHQTITPSLDNIKDGRYIQYFDELMKLDSKGNISIVENQIASYFEVKNNVIDGFSISLNPKGDTIEKGFYDNGKRVGKWEFSALKDFDLTISNLKEKPIYDKVYCEYVEGVIEGEYLETNAGKTLFKGFYTNGNPTGEWFNYAFHYDFDPNIKKTIETHYLKQHFTYAKDYSKNKSKKPFIRNTPFLNIYPSDSLNIPANVDELRINFNTFYKFPIEEVEDYELPEEKINSYEGEDYLTQGELNNLYLNAEGNAWISNKYISKGKLIDSLGIQYLFDGIYEEFYPNKTLKFRYEFKNGELVKEDNLFWDNGVVANRIEFDEDSKNYFQKYFDYIGEILVVEKYDSLGKFIEKETDFISNKKVKIENYDTKYYPDLNFYEYECFDTLNKPIHSTLSFYKSWYGNFKPMSSYDFNPNEREVKIELRSLNQTVKNDVLYTFGEDYKFFSSKSNYYYKDLISKIISNGSYKGFEKNDSIPHARIYNLTTAYEITDDYQLFQEEKLYSGKFEVNYNKKKFKYKSSNSLISIDFTGYKQEKKIKKEIEKYLKTGSFKYKDLITIIEGNPNYQSVFKEVFPIIYEVNPENAYMNDLYYDESYTDKEIEKLFSKTEKIVGQFENGKPTGKWIAYDQFGKIKNEIEFLNGEKHGTAKYYNYAYPKNKNSYEYYEEPLVEFPTKTVYYLEHIQNFKNGILNGEEKYFDWQGNLTYSGNYKDGFLDGKSMEINKLITSISRYEEGLLDGISSVKLTLPERDTITLFELNFQNHQLQGESKSYHTNGKVAKRGFFLNNEPIEDYEAFDSLGTKYHYVKFLYSYPIEEKIWEENELSVRYLFDWKDSIYFRPDDIVNIPSAYDLYYQYGLVNQSEFEQPYYGRASIVDKTGIKYHVTKYYPDQKVARDGSVNKGKKEGLWSYFNYDGKKIYEINYFDTILKINDSIKFKSKGIRTDFDENDKAIHKSYVIEKIENYDCSHTDHYEIRQFYTIWEANNDTKRTNDYVKNYYDDGTLQSEGRMLNGLPSGVWKFYTPNGMLNQVGEYVQGKRHGRWLKGDLSKTKYLGDICMNPNLPDLEKRIEYQENMLDIEIRYFKLGKIQKSEYYGINMNLKNK